MPVSLRFAEFVYLYRRDALTPYLPFRSSNVMARQYAHDNVPTALVHHAFASLGSSNKEAVGAHPSSSRGYGVCCFAERKGTGTDMHLNLCKLQDD